MIEAFQNDPLKLLSFYFTLYCIPGLVPLQQMLADVQLMVAFIFYFMIDPSFSNIDSSKP